MVKEMDCLIRIWDVDIDSENNIWLELMVLECKSLMVIHFTQYDVEKMVLLILKDFHIYVDDYDKVWVGTYGGGVVVFDGETWNTLDKRDGIVDNDISALTS